MSAELKKAMDEMAAAEATYEAARKDAAYARNRETDALNRLNAAQKAVDKAIDAIRSQSSPGSDWRAGKVTRFVGATNA